MSRIITVPHIRKGLSSTYEYLPPGPCLLRRCGPQRGPWQLNPSPSALGCCRLLSSRWLASGLCKNDTLGTFHIHLQGKMPNTSFSSERLWMWSEYTRISDRAAVPSWDSWQFWISSWREYCLKKVWAGNIFQKGKCLQRLSRKNTYFWVKFLSTPSKPIKCQLISFFLNKFSNLLLILTNSFIYKSVNLFGMHTYCDLSKNSLVEPKICWNMTILITQFLFSWNSTMIFYSINWSHCKIESKFQKSQKTKQMIDWWINVAKCSFQHWMIISGLTFAQETKAHTPAHHSLLTVAEQLLASFFQCQVFEQKNDCYHFSSSRCDCQGSNH